MTIDFHPEAESEYLASIRYYEKKAEGLGEEFYAEIQTALALLRSFPEIGSPFEASDRKFSLNRFPFSLVYNYEESEKYIEVYAVMHQNRKPGYWISRR